MTVHGSLLEVHGVGVLLLGPSGVGKSECALELVSRGHRLVADDAVELTRGDDGRLVGRAPERIRDHMEIRGLGIVCIRDLFGPQAVGDRMEIDLVCRLERLREESAYDRLGLDPATECVEGVEVPLFRLPARPGASMATVVEVAAREQRQRAAGVSAARRLDERLRGEMGEP